MTPVSRKLIREPLIQQSQILVGETLCIGEAENIHTIASHVSPESSLLAQLIETHFMLPTI